MISLNSKIVHNFTTDENFVLKVEKNSQSINSCLENSNKFETSYGSFQFINNIELEEGEILIIFPKYNFIERFFRPNANANTILLTENCDQKCIMCSQPPKNKDYLYFDLYEKACVLLPMNTFIGISGGEPTLFKKELFQMINKVIEKRPDIKFHILSNGQHFEKSDMDDLKATNDNILWAVPLYSSSEVIHDLIVSKKGAYKKLYSNLDYLCLSGSNLEIRTVFMKTNAEDLENIALKIHKNFSWLQVWAIMQLEKIGYAKMNWKSIFYDSSFNFDPIAKALTISKIYNINAKLYNFPICTVPAQFRSLAVKSISDWKQKYLDDCKNCLVKNDCCGFFEWYDDSYKNVRAIN